jgi:hypothetical protein
MRTILPSRIGRLDVGIFLVSFAVLLTELLLTRIFSVTMFYHLSFLVVSLAMLGFGASGLIVNLAPGGFPKEKLFLHAALGSVFFAITSVAAIGVSFRLPISLDSSAANWARIGAVYLMCAIPFLFGGLVVSLILTHRPAEANRLYFADLLGAALGCVALIPATNGLGAPSAVLLAAAIAATAGAVLAPPSAPSLRHVASALAGLLIVGLLTNGRLHWYDVRFVKGVRQPPTLALRWNSFSRVEVVGTPRTLWMARPPNFPGFSARLDPDFAIPEVGLRYDADASTQITYFDGDPRRIEFLRYDVTSSPYQLRHYQSALVIGPGGGRDILTALSFGTGAITGVEINPITVDLMRTRFSTFTHGLYNEFPGVTIVTDDGRSFLRHGDARYDLIEASLVDTWAASAAGAYALTENSLYTVDAFSDYFDHLNRDGVVCFNRWFANPPVESLRVVVLAREALARRGIENPSDHIIVVRTDPDETGMSSLGSILVKLSPFSPSEIAGVQAFATDMGFLLPYVPGQKGNEFSDLLGPRSAEMVASYPYDLSAVSDDRPFFFSRVPILPRILSLLHLSRSRLGSMPLDLGGRTLLGSVVAAASATVLLLLLPFWGKRRRATRAGTKTARNEGLWALYFASLGLGFILIEIVLIQRFSLFLGYPVYSLSVVLFTMLLSSALGSLVSGRFKAPSSLSLVLVVLASALILYAVALPPALAAARGATIAARIGVTVAVIAPLGFLMGMPFPSGIRHAGARSKELVSWAWAVNGGASVFGSTLSVVISMARGFTATFVAGTLVYAVALVVITLLARQPAPLAPEPTP